MTEKSGSIAVFCGARPGARPEQLRFAAEFGATLVRRGLNLVYGASNVGVMGALADAVRAAGGDVTGVIPHSLLEREPLGSTRGTVFVVRSMHERKALMYRLSSGFAVLPGGIGTLDELMEVATWKKLSLIDKPLVVVNHQGFFDPMLGMLDHLVSEGFLGVTERRLFQVARDAEEALDRIDPGRPAATAPAAAVPANIA
jgi:uncharacterized protein (TIGR00730 family)